MYFMLDAIDSKAIAALQDGRPGELGGPRHGAGLSAPAAAERVRKLVDGGIIRGFTAVLDPETAGFPVLAFVAVTLEAQGARARLPRRRCGAHAADPGVPPRRRRRRLPAQGAGAEPVGARVGAGRRAEGTPRHRPDADDDRAGDGEGDDAAAGRGRTRPPAAPATGSQASGRSTEALNHCASAVVLGRLGRGRRDRHAEDLGADRRVLEGAVQVGADHARGAGAIALAVVQHGEGRDLGGHRGHAHVDLVGRA